MRRVGILAVLLAISLAFYACTDSPTQAPELGSQASRARPAPAPAESRGVPPALSDITSVASPSDPAPPASPASPASGQACPSWTQEELDYLVDTIAEDTTACAEYTGDLAGAYWFLFRPCPDYDHVTHTVLALSDSSGYAYCSFKDFRLVCDTAAHRDVDRFVDNLTATQYETCRAQALASATVRGFDCPLVP
jgi:hypothetical protein